MAYTTAIPRQNFCSKLSGLANISSPVINYNALGYNNSRPIVVGINLDAPPHYITFDPVSKLPNGGLMFYLHNELAKRGKFSIQYKLVKNFNSYQSTDDFLSDILPTVDIFGGFPVADTTRRRILQNFDFTRQISDLSIILISPASIKSNFILWSFLLPFDDNLWLAVIGAVLLYAILFYCLERFSFDLADIIGTKASGIVEEGEDADVLTAHHVPFYLSLYSSFLSMVMLKADVAPRKIGTRIMSVGFNFFMLVVSNAYLANQANLLVAPSEVQLRVLTVETALRDNLPICALAGENEWCMDCAAGAGTPYSIVSASFPTLKLVDVEANDPVELLKKVNDGICAGAIMTQVEWDFVRNKRAGNKYCNMMQSPVLIRLVSGGWPIIADYGAFRSPVTGRAVNPSSRCLSTVAIVISSLIADMRGDGTMQSLFSRAQAKYWDQACISLDKQPIDPSLRLSDLTGIVAVYAMTCLFALALICFCGPFRNQIRYGKEAALDILPPSHLAGSTSEDEGEQKVELELSARRRHQQDQQSERDVPLGGTWAKAPLQQQSGQWLQSRGRGLLNISGGNSVASGTQSVYSRQGFFHDDV